MRGGAPGRRSASISTERLLVLAVVPVGGMITIVVQTLVRNMAGAQKDLYLGWTLALGRFVSTVIAIVVGAISDHSRGRWETPSVHHSGDGAVYTRAALACQRPLNPGPHGLTSASYSSG